MKKIPQLYVKNSKGRYEEYKIPEHDISNTLYGKVNGRYEPVYKDMEVIKRNLRKRKLNHHIFD